MVAAAAYCLASYTVNTFLWVGLSDHKLKYIFKKYFLNLVFSHFSLIP